MRFNIKEIQEACAKCDVDESTILHIFSNLPNKRSNKVNASLHKLFTHMSNSLNELGHTFTYQGLNKLIELKYTPEIVKNFIWKPLQNALFEKSSTTQLTNADIKLIFEVLEKWFAERGIEIVFPAQSEDYANYLLHT